MAALLAAAPSLAQNLLPMPQSVEWTKGNFRTDKPFVIETTLPANQILLKDWKGWKTGKNSENRQIVFKQLAGDPNSEAYELSVNEDYIVIAAHSPAGFRYAQNTLKQLQDGSKLPCCVIKDAPAYQWRGVMIDVSRHFFPISFLKEQIDLLATYKFNRLHLHLTDAAGWRMEIKRYPRLTSLAAWRTNVLWKTWWNDGKREYAQEGSENAHGGYYTQEELRDLVKYAAERGITIIPEIEMPAHSEEVLTAYPELSCTHEPYKQADFCPGSVATYDFLENVLKEVMDVFPSPYIHVGGDEAGKASWPNCPLCQQKMKEEGIKEVKGLQTYLIRHMGHFLNENGRQLLGWDEIIDGDLAQGTTVMVWRNIDYALDAIQHGYDVVLSPGSHCYLDGYQDAPNTQPEAIGGFSPLEKVYHFTPGEGMTAEQKKHIKGVQANLWTEYIPTESHAEYMLYPRLLAISEIAWNGTPKKDYNEFKQRAIKEVDHLHKIGVNAFDLRKEVGDRKEALTPLKHKALGAKVTYNKPYNSHYKGSDEVTLTDGLRGGWNYGDGRWQGFIGRNNLDVTIDLGKVESIKYIGTDFLQCSGPEIYFPAIYNIYISEDGKNFTEIYKKGHKVSKLPLNETEVWSWKGKKKARYIRVEANTTQAGGWIFADEIEVQ